MDKKIIEAIDIGSTKVVTLIAQIESDTSVRILGVGIEPSSGIKKGTVTDIPMAANAIAESVKKAERTSGMEINSAIVSITGNHISAVNNKASVGVAGGKISQYDVDRVLDAVRAMPIPHNRTIIHPLQRTFTVDGIEGIRAPIGMFGSRLDVESYIITGATSTIENLRQCVMTAEIEVTQFVLTPLADAEAILSDIEKQMGVIVCDIGGGTTSLAIYINGDIWHTNVIPVGGMNITTDIAQAFHLPYSQAEEIKKVHGHALPDFIGDDEFFYTKSFGDQEAVRCGRKDLAKIINMRTEEIFQLILQEVKRSGYDNLLPAGLVLTGGSALLPGIDKLGSDVLGMPVRIAKPENLTGMIDQLDSPAFSTSVGLLYWALMMQESSEPQTGEKDRSKVASSVKKFLKSILP